MSRAWKQLLQTFESLLTRLLQIPGIDSRAVLAKRQTLTLRDIRLASSVHAETAMSTWSRLSASDLHYVRIDLLTPSCQGADLPCATQLRLIKPSIFISLPAPKSKVNAGLPAT